MEKLRDAFLLIELIAATGIDTESSSTLAVALWVLFPIAGYLVTDKILKERRKYHDKSRRV